jgi:hypothetical protein
VTTATLVRSAAAFAGDTALHLGVHAGEATLASVAYGSSSGVLVFLGLSHDVQVETVNWKSTSSTGATAFLVALYLAKTAF